MVESAGVDLEFDVSTVELPFCHAIAHGDYDCDAQYMLRSPAYSTLDWSFPTSLELMNGPSFTSEGFYGERQKPLLLGRRELQLITRCYRLKYTYLGTFPEVASGGRAAGACQWACEILVLHCGALQGVQHRVID